MLCAQQSSRVARRRRPSTATTGTIDAGKYDVWKSNFGNRSSSDAGEIARMPEPTTLWLRLVGILTMCSRRRARVS
jgi:hypothetical protein